MSLLPPNPFQARVEYFNINGVDAMGHLNQMHVYFTMKKAFHTCKLLLIDSTNAVMKLLDQGNPPSVSFGFNCGEALSRDFTFYAFSTHGEKHNKSARSKMYTVQCVGTEFFCDRTNIVQEQFNPGIPITTIINSISSKYLALPCNIVQPSVGPCNAETNHTTNAKKPFRAIIDLCQRANGGGIGNYIHFKDLDQGVLGPLTTIVQQASPLMQFFQNQTIGGAWPFDIQNSAYTMLTVGANYEERGTLFTPSTVGALTGQANKAWDHHTKKYAINIPSMSFGGGGFSMPGVGNLGKSAFQNFMNYDSIATPTQTSRQQKNPQERADATQWGMNPQITMTVGLQKGMYCNIGQAVNAQLLPAVSDQQTISGAGDSDLSGDYCVQDMCWSIHLDDRPHNINAYCTMNCIKKEPLSA